MSKVDWDQFGTVQEEWDKYGKVEASANPPSISPRGEKFRAMPWHQQLDEGAGGAARSTYLGIKNLLGQGTPEEAKEQEEWHRDKEHLGLPGAAGEFAIDTALTAPISAVTGGVGGYTLPLAMRAVGPATKAGLVLKRANEVKNAIAGVGGKFANVGRTAQSGADAAIAAGLQTPGEGQTRGGNMVAGGVLGTIIPTGATTVTGIKPFVRPMGLLESHAQQRAMQGLEKTYGKDLLEDVYNKVNDPNNISRLPQTTAARADSLAFGEGERAARERNINKMFSTHDVDVLDKSYSHLLDETATSKTPKELAEAKIKLKNAGDELLSNYRLDDGGRNVLTNELKGALKEPDISPLAKSRIESILKRLSTDKNLTAKGLHDMHESLNELGDQAAIQTAQDSLRFVGDSLSNKRFGEHVDMLKATIGEEKEATALHNIRSKFVSDKGIPATESSINTGERVIPKIEEANLRRALIKFGDDIDPSTHANIYNIADELRKHEIHKRHTDTGGGGIQLDKMAEHATGIANVTPYWQAKGPLKILYQRGDRKTNQMIDEAFRYPEKFTALMDAKRLHEQPLTAEEQMIYDTILNAPARGIGARQGE